MVRPYLPTAVGKIPIEPIALGIPLVLGPNYQNFHQTCSDLLVHDAIRITESAEEAKSSLVELARSGPERQMISQQARDWMESQGSPSQQTLEKIYSLLKNTY